MLRAEVLAGQPRPEGLGAVRYHGMVRGLAVILAAVASPRTVADRRAPVTRELPPEREFVRVLANMLLHTQSELMHVY